MSKRPLSVTVISWIFIAVGGIALINSLLPLTDPSAAWRIADHPYVFWLIPLIEILAIGSGVFMLYRFNWARWLLVVWIGYHIILSVLHSALQVIVHSLLFAVVLYFLFRPETTTYFREKRSIADADPEDI
ncbi:MAG: hypothetical protein J2P31_10385 [Blastocatellia bacterium]|nr:hypothetical protein [Blastocatellia bacterium]